MFNIKGKKIWVSGHNGMVGRAVVKTLKNYDCEILTVDRHELDLSRQQKVEDWMAAHKPDAIVICAAKVGGILANDTYPADFIYNNIILETNIINAAYEQKVKKLVFLGSSCIYPKLAEQPIKENDLLSGHLEETNQWYAIAKIAGIKLCQAYRKQHGCDFISAMPTNLYGPHDNFNLETSHVIPALIRKTCEAKAANASELIVWGSGTPRREFLHVDDCAEGIVFLLENYSNDSHVNLGTGQDVTIYELSELIKEAIEFKGNIVFDPSKPDGPPQKCLDVSLMKSLGWQSRIMFHEGLQDTVKWFYKNCNSLYK